MGWMVCRFTDLDIEVPLSPSTRIGRHWSNDIVVAHPAMPLYWVEIRWEQGGWRFRCLSGEGRTRAKGPRRGEWTCLKAASGQGSRVTIEDVGQFELVDDREPVPMLVDCETGVRHIGPEIRDVIYAHGEVAEGGKLHWNGRLYRMEGIGPLVVAQVGEIDIAHPDCHIHVDVDTLTAQISQGHAQVMIEGEPVRTLAVYVAARLSGQEDGWLNSEDAYAAWVYLGGSETSPIARIGWERGKLRRGLSIQEVDNSKRLFSVRRRASVSVKDASACFDSVRSTSRIDWDESDALASRTWYSQGAGAGVARGGKYAVIWICLSFCGCGVRRKEHSGESRRYDGRCRGDHRQR
jgi:hypothetical protein